MAKNKHARQQGKQALLKIAKTTHGIANDIADIELLGHIQFQIDELKDVIKKLERLERGDYTCGEDGPTTNIGGGGTGND